MAGPALPRTPRISLLAAVALVLVACVTASLTLAGFAAVGPVPLAVAAMSRAKHSSTPFQVDEKGKADRPKQDEAHDHQGDPGGPGDVVQSFHKARHRGLPSYVSVNGCKC